MPIVSIKEMSGKSGSVNSSFQRTYSRTWVIVTDNPADGPFVIGSTPGLPLIFDPYPEDNRAFCVSLTPTQDSDNPQVYRVEATYAYQVDGASSGGSVPMISGNPLIDSQQKGQPPSQRQSNPLNRPRDYSYATSNAGTRAAEKDASDSKILNTAKLPLSPPIMVDIPALTLTIGLNAATGPSAAWAESVGCLNSNPLVIGGYTIAANHARLKGVSANSVFEEGISYWRWQIVFEIRETWDKVITSKGLMAYQYEKDATGNKVKSAKPKPILRNGKPITQPVFLDANGFEATTEADAKDQTFSVYKSKIFPTPL